MKSSLENHVLGSDKGGTAWHQMEVAAVLDRFATDRAHGLSEQEVNTRRAQFGRNELVERGRKSVWNILKDQLTGVFVAILMLAGVASIALGDYSDAAAIFAIMLLNTIIGFVQEFRAEKAIAALKKLAVPPVAVFRSGKLQVVASSELVPGDILILESGNIVPADGRVIEIRNLRVQESVLTGEPEPVEKHLEPLEVGDLPLGDRRNMVYMGTPVTYGRAEVVVTETGMRTELGRIAEMIQTVERQSTPLQQRLSRLARDLALAAVFLVSLVVLTGLLRGDDLRVLFFTSISLLVAAVPEGLPAVVTIALALGTQRMLRRRTLVRKLAAVETLGSVSVICSDKTGTLTENRMTVMVADVSGRRLKVADHMPARPDLHDSGYILLMTGAALCNDAVLEKAADDGGDGNPFHAIGDPTEAALVVAAAKSGLLKPELERVFPRVNEIPFESGRKRMTTVHRVDSDKVGAADEAHLAMRKALAAIGIAVPTEHRTHHLAFTKGAVDGLLPLCAYIWEDGHKKPLTQSRLERIEGANEELAQTGMRVLGIAAKAIAGTTKTEANDLLEQELTFIGLVGLSDPARDGVKSAIETCRSAGIRTVMITGDHPATANQIAHELTISLDGRIISGTDLARMDVEDLVGIVDEVPVYARVSPEHKLKIVEALQRRGHIVAMTGDGVNDAPALRKANIGVAMGVTGTDVAKEAADMVLLDDNFTTIVAAVEEGRVIYENLRKFIKYILTGNVAEIAVVLLAPLVGMPLPLLPLQILWINLVTDGLPGLALAIEPAEQDTMKRRPRRLEEGIFAEGTGLQIIWIGLLVGFVSLALGYSFWLAGRSEWQTMVFTTLTLSELAAVLTIRSSRESVFRIGFFSNRHLIVIVALTALLQMALLYVRPLQIIFRTSPLTAADLGLSLALAAVVFAFIEAQKYWVRRRPA
jgi:Ca2+-transporting ATPase